MSRKSILATAVLILSVSRPSFAAGVRVTLIIDEPILPVGQTTTAHLFAEVWQDPQPDNGIYAYALNVLADSLGPVGIDSVTQLGSPDPFLSDPGTILPDGLHDVYGGDGGYFADQNRGIGSPFEVLSLELRGLAEGTVTFTAGVADSAALLGITDGFLLQQPGSVDTTFESVTVTVIPEPSALAFLAFAVAALGRRRR